MKKRATYPELLGVLLHLPWPVELGLGVFFFILFDAMSRSFGLGSSDGNTLRPWIAEASGTLAILLPAALVASALASLLGPRPPRS